MAERAPAETATGFKKNTLGGPGSHCRVWMEITELATEEILTAQTLTLPTTQLPCRHFPTCRFHDPDVAETLPAKWQCAGLTALAERSFGSPFKIQGISHRAIEPLHYPCGKPASLAFKAHGRQRLQSLNIGC